LDLPDRKILTPQVTQEEAMSPAICREQSTWEGQHQAFPRTLWSSTQSKFCYVASCKLDNVLQTMQTICTNRIVTRSKN